MLKKTLDTIKPSNKKDFNDKLQTKLDRLTKPQGSLGKLEEIAKKYGIIKESVKPTISKKHIYTFAGDHGIASSGVSLFPAAVTPQMVLNFIRGGAGVNVLAKHAGAVVNVVDIGVNYDFGNIPELLNKKIAPGTNDFSTGPAMTKEQAIEAIEVGIEIANQAAQNGVDIIGTGDMGIGNTTASSAIVSVLCSVDPESVTGRGTGIDDKALENKIAMIKKGISTNNPDKSDPIDVLAKVGGFEIAGIAGLVLGAAANNIAVVADGFISSTGALIAYELNNNIADYLFSSHLSVEKGHRAIFDRIKIEPILDLNMRLGEGTGACLAISIIEASINILNEMATFQEAGVSEA